MLAATVPATLEPSTYAVVRDELRNAEFDSEIDSYVEVASREIDGLNGTIQELRTQVDESANKLFDSQAEVEWLNSELNRMSGQLFHVQKEFGAFQRGEPAEDVPDLPDSVRSISDAILLAKELPNVLIHDLAPVDIEELESSVESGAWAETIWRGLRALDAYISEREPGKTGFWEWCKRGQSAWTWNASTKRLAMTESETVLNDPRLRAKRQFPVSEQISSTGNIEMLAHLKIAEGGGPKAPRIYFLDDSDGATGKIHMGVALLEGPVIRGFPVNEPLILL